MQSATTGFIASIFPSRNRVSPKEAFEGPEPYDGKLSRPVLRGLAPSNGGWLLGDAGFQVYKHQEVQYSAATVTRLPFFDRAPLYREALV
jgi:hypothetical protein